MQPIQILWGKVEALNVTFKMKTYIRKYKKNLNN